MPRILLYCWSTSYFGPHHHFARGHHLAPHLTALRGSEGGQKEKSYVQST